MTCKVSINILYDKIILHFFSFMWLFFVFVLSPSKSLYSVAMSLFWFFIFLFCIRFFRKNGLNERKIKHLGIFFQIFCMYNGNSL